GGLDLGQHDVRRPAQAADLGARITLGHASVQVSVGDLSRGFLDVDQRPQVGADHRDACHQQLEDDHDADDQVDAGKSLDGAVYVADIRPDDHGAGGVVDQPVVTGQPPSVAG